MPRERSDASFRRLFEVAPSALLVVDTEGRISLANIATRKLFAYTESTLIGQSIEMLIPAPPWNELEPTLRPMDAHCELRARRRDGTDLAVNVSLSAVRYPHGAILAFARTTTEPERTEVERRRDRKHARQLPAELAAELCAAAHVADYDRLTTLLAHVATEHPIVASALREFIEQYRYEEIEALLRA